MNDAHIVAAQKDRDTVVGDVLKGGKIATAEDVRIIQDIRKMAGMFCCPLNGDTPDHRLPCGI